MPRRKVRFEIGLCPRYGLALRYAGPELESGAQPQHFERHLYGGALPRLISGGKAESLPAQNIWAPRRLAPDPRHLAPVPRHLLPGTRSPSPT